MRTSCRGVLSFFQFIILIAVVLNFGCLDKNRKALPPSEPRVSGILPGIVANENMPTLTGISDPGTGIFIFTDANCSTAPVAQTIADGNGHFTVQVTVGNDSINGFIVRAVNSAGLFSPCSIYPIFYFEDSTNPVSPSITSVLPASPANNNDPQITGTAEAGTTVEIFANGSCSGASIASTTSDVNTGIFTDSVHVDDNSVTVYSVRSTDIAGNHSTCLANAFTYVEDSINPSAATIMGSNPASGANHNMPVLFGESEPLATVRIHTTSTCSDAPAAQGQANASGNFAIPVSVADDSTTVFYASVVDLSGNTSACSTVSYIYLEDSTAPGEATFLSFTPVAPANFNIPVLSGAGEVDATVKFYTTSACSGAAVATTTVDSLGEFQAPLAVLDNTTTTFYATQTDAAGNTSACSTTPIIFIEDSTPASAVTITSVTPGPVANNNAPGLEGTTEANAVVKIFTNPICSGSPTATVTADGSGNFSTVVNVGDDTVTAFYATATDAANNSSACSTSSISYVEDSTAPSEPSFTGTIPLSPANNNSPLVNGTSEVNSIVRVYTDSACTSTYVETTATNVGEFSASMSVADDSTSIFYATSTDAAGNVSGCSSVGIAFIEDSTPPDTLTFLGTTPASPADNNDPEVFGLSNPGASVQLFTDSSCSSAVAGSGSSNGLGEFSIAVHVADNTVTSFWAKATDSSGNASNCSVGSITYAEQTAIPLEVKFYGAAMIGEVTVVIPSQPDQICRQDCIVNAIPGTTATLTMNTGVGGVFLGWNGAGCSGTGICSYTFTTTPAQVIAGFTRVGVREIATGSFHSCAVLDDGRVACWGQNSLGQLGDSSISQTNNPIIVPGITNAKRVFAGNAHTCVQLQTTNRLQCWGNNNQGQVGVGSTSATIPAPQNVTFIDDGAFNVSLGFEHSCALSVLGSGSCWGNNGNRQLGTFSATNPQRSPGAVNLLSTNFKGISAGINHSCAVVGTTVYCWGKNESSQLGDGLTATRPTPFAVPVPGIQFKQVSVGSSQTFAKTAANTVYAWGNNSAGLLGDPTLLGTTPAEMTTLSGVEKVKSSYENEACALLDDGSMKCWGDNTYGQLGIGSNSPASSPIEVTGLDSVTNFDISSRHACAIRADKTVYCWGDNASGQLGDGYNAQQQVPVQVFGI